MSAFIPPEWTECNIDDTNWFRTVTTIGSLLLTVRTCRRSKVWFQIEPSDGSLTIQHMPLNCSVLAYICHVCPLWVDSDIITLWNGQGLFQPVFVCFMKARQFQRWVSPAPVLVLWLVNQFNISSTPTIKGLASAAVSEFCKLKFTKIEWVSKSLYAAVPACSWEDKKVSMALWVWLPANSSHSGSQDSPAPTVPTGKILISGGQGELPLQAVFLPNAAQNTMLAIFLLISYWSE